MGLNRQGNKTGETHQLRWEEGPYRGSKTDSNTREDKIFKIKQEVFNKNIQYRF